MESVIQLATVLFIFLFVLGITYFVTTWIGNYNKTQFSSKNIELIEAGRLTQNQYIQIVRVANKYLVLTVCKDRVDCVAQLSEEDLDLTEGDSMSISGSKAFSKILEKAKNTLSQK